MKRVLSFLTAALFCGSIFAQEAPAAPAKPESNWKRGILTQIGFSQLSLTNWAAGGSGSVSLNAYLDIYADYKKEKHLWANDLQLGYGFIQSFEDGYKKSDDRIIFDSKYGYKVSDRLYISSVYNFRTQFAEGINASGNRVSDFFAPAYMSLGFGIDYQPYKNCSINFAPLTGKLVMVSDEELRPLYGNAEDQFARFELGAQLKIDNIVEVQDFKVKSSLTLFSDYLNKPLNVKVGWDLNADAKISRFFSVSLRTSLLYDDNIKSKRKKIDAETVEMVPGVQFKELFSVGFSYTFGAAK